MTNNVDLLPGALDILNLIIYPFVENFPIYFKLSMPQCTDITVLVNLFLCKLCSPLNYHLLVMIHQQH